MPISINSTGSGTKVWSVSAGALPTGITLNTSTGVLSGTPTTAGAYSFTLRVELVGCASSFDTQTYSGTIQAANSSTSETTTSSTTTPPTTTVTTSSTTVPSTTSSTTSAPTTSSTSSPPVTTSSTTTPTTSSSTSQAPLPIQSEPPLLDGVIVNNFRWAVSTGCPYGVVIFYRNGTQIGLPVVASATGIASINTIFNTGDVITAKQTCPSNSYQSEQSNQVTVTSATGFCPTPMPCLIIDQCGLSITTLPSAEVALYFNNNQLLGIKTADSSGEVYFKLTHAQGSYSATALAPNMAISPRSCPVQVKQVSCCPPPVTPNYQLLPLI